LKEGEPGHWSFDTKGWQRLESLVQVVELTSATSATWIDTQSRRPVPPVGLAHAPGRGRVNGVAAASQAFFGKRPNDLLIPEAALLAAVLPNPRRLDVRNPSPYVRERAAWIEQQMALLGGPAYLKPL